ncbi:7774_t:CDS:2 [Funneliformis geosporum]|nr:7774_t:CDS:2 [Funneliformis geosporum]
MDFSQKFKCSLCQLKKISNNKDYSTKNSREINNNNDNIVDENHDDNDDNEVDKVEEINKVEFKKNLINNKKDKVLGIEINDIKLNVENE